MSDSGKAFDDFDALGLIDILPANGRAVVGAAWVICWQAARSKALEEAAKEAESCYEAPHMASEFENGVSSGTDRAAAAIRALKEQA